jgi:S-formylglutathione hydrolase FrmB
LELLDVSLETGWLPWTVIVLGVLGAIFLLCRRERWWWIYVVPGVLIASAVVAWIIGHGVAESLFAEPLKMSDIVWIGVAIAAVGLAIGFMFRTSWWRKIVAVLAAVFVIAMAGNQINKSFSEYPRLGDLLGVASDQQIDGPPLVDSENPTAPLPSGPLTSVWTPTGANIPTDGKGKVSQIDLPATLSGFQAREGWVYYPPAYFADNPEPLPVLVLLHGQPGGPDDWQAGDRVQTAMNAYAAAHNGIAPVVVMPDATGGPTDNPICTDSSLGKVDTFLSLDVPNAIKSQLRVQTDPKHWAVGGFSYGGTCALQLVTNHPDVYTSFIDISGQDAPTLGSRQQTIDTAFGGNEAKYKAVNPQDIMAAKQFPEISGWFIVGGDDTDVVSQQKKVYAAAETAGMDVQYWEVPGTGHDWSLGNTSLDHGMPWLGQRLGLTE